MRNISDEILENLKTHILCSVTFFQMKVPQMAIWRMRVAYWIPKATNTHSGNLIITAFLLQKLLHESD
jgi:hypothetical protein